MRALGVTAVEQRAVEEACLSAGARRVYLIESPSPRPWAPAFPSPSRRGTSWSTWAAAPARWPSSPGLHRRLALLRIGGYEFDDAILALRALQPGRGRADGRDLKFQIGSAHPLERELTAEVRGRDLVSGLPKSVDLTSQEVRSAFQEPLRAIVESVKETLEETPPELAADISGRGPCWRAGARCCATSTSASATRAQMPAYLAESPLTCVAVGAGRSLTEFEALERAQPRAGRRR